MCFINSFLVFRIDWGKESLKNNMAKKFLSRLQYKLRCCNMIAFKNHVNPIMNFHKIKLTKIYEKQNKTS